MASTSIKTNTKAGEFKLELPAELQIAPLWEVHLPAKHVALVFKDEERSWVQDRHTGVGSFHITQGYRLIIRKANGGPPVALRARDYDTSRWCGSFYADLLTVKLAIEADAEALKPKVKKTTERRDFEEEDEE